MSTAIRVLEKCAFAAGGEDGDPQTVAGREDNRLRARVGASGRIVLMSFPGRGLPDLTASGPRIRPKAPRPRRAALVHAESKRIVFSHGRGRQTGAWIMRRDR
jgi:hypothetical protein